jgi:hypothetical protein
MTTVIGARPQITSLSDSQALTDLWFSRMRPIGALSVPAG